MEILVILKMKSFKTYFLQLYFKIFQGWHKMEEKHK